MNTKKKNGLGAEDSLGHLEHGYALKVSKILRTVNRE